MILLSPATYLARSSSRHNGLTRRAGQEPPPFAGADQRLPAPVRPRRKDALAPSLPRRPPAPRGQGLHHHRRRHPVGHRPRRGAPVCDARRRVRVPHGHLDGAPGAQQGGHTEGRAQGQGRDGAGGRVGRGRRGGDLQEGGEGAREAGCFLCRGRGGHGQPEGQLRDLHARDLHPDPDHQLPLGVPRDQARRRGDEGHLGLQARRGRLHRHRCLGHGSAQHGPRSHAGVPRQQGRRDQPRADGRVAPAQHRDPGQHHLPRDHRHADDQGHVRPRAQPRLDRQGGPAQRHGPVRHTRGDRQRRGVPGVGRLELHHGDPHERGRGGRGERAAADPAFAVAWGSPPDESRVELFHM